MKKARVLLFDIDGTLLHTGGAGRIAFERVFEDIYGHKSVWGGLRPDGKTDPMIIHEITERVLGRRLEGSEYETLAQTYLDYFEEEMMNPPSFRVLPGIVELFESGVLGGFIKGVATGNFEKAAWIKLETAKIRHHFEFGGFGSDAGDRVGLTRIAYERACRLSGKFFEPEECVVIGDTRYDIRAGKALGMKTVAVATGGTPKSELSEEKPDFLFLDLQSPEAFLAALHA